MLYSVGSESDNLYSSILFLRDVMRPGVMKSSIL
jgi:hypothetical protein